VAFCDPPSGSKNFGLRIAIAYENNDEAQLVAHSTSFLGVVRLKAD